MKFLKQIKEAIISFFSPKENLQSINQDINELLKMGTYKPKWYYVCFPFLPRISYNENLHLLTVVFGDFSTTTKSLTKTHFFDVLINNYKTKWYQPKYVGFQIWRPW